MGFNGHEAAPKRIRVADEPVIQMTMPDLEEEKIDPVEPLAEEQPAEDPGIAAPTLADVPSLAPIDAFVQPLDPTPALAVSIDAVRLSVVPVNIAHHGSAERLGRIFNVAELDRQPEPTFQPSPVFPAELRKEYPEVDVEVEFIISARGEVLSPRAISSVPHRFEEAAVRAVEKWKFRAGRRNGRAVNTRTQIAIKFRAVGDK